ncbi:MAG: DUF2461 domain-containing protein [Flavobacteriales bacterium]|nr:DUF2461 domain-containing protein [Flavobacteriales bacterium]
MNLLIEQKGLSIAYYEMKNFSSDFNQFFKELAANNHKDWFDQNRDRYHRIIKEPFETFITVLINELMKDDPRLNVDPKSTIFRINRDIRFSKDKSPYKLNRSAAIAPNGKKSIAQGGIYIEIGPARVAVGGGAFQPEKEELQRLRKYIVNHPKEFRKAVDDEQFNHYFKEIYGKANKRLPTKELMIASQIEPLLLKKSMYYLAEESPDLVESDELLPRILEYHAAAKPLRDFIARAVS